MEDMKEKYSKNSRILGPGEEVNWGSEGEYGTEKDGTESLGPCAPQSAPGSRRRVPLGALHAGGSWRRRQH